VSLESSPMDDTNEAGRGRDGLKNILQTCVKTRVLPIIIIIACRIVLYYNRACVCMISTVRQGVPENGYNENKNKIYIQMCIIMKPLQPDKIFVIDYCGSKIRCVCVCVCVCMDIYILYSVIHTRYILYNFYAHHIRTKRT